VSFSDYVAFFLGSGCDGILACHMVGVVVGSLFVRTRLNMNYNRQELGRLWRFVGTLLLITTLIVTIFMFVLGLYEHVLR
jgi:hypothetical protein